MTTSDETIATEIAPATFTRDFFSPDINLLNHLETLMGSLDGGESCQTVELRRRGNSPTDIKLFFRGRDWLLSPAGREVQEFLKSDPAVADLKQKGTTITLRFSDDFVEETGRRLECGDIATLDASNAISGKKYAVGFAGPNTSKALHIGHLRNITIGSALAGTLAAAGADVVRQSLVGDIGRNICEAMAGLRTLYPDGIPADRKPDHLIGECYARYVQESSAGISADDAGADPAMRECRVADDLADEYMRGWLAGDTEARELWRHTRDLVLEGHRQTLERFGISIDRHDYESGSMDDVPALIDHGVRAGILRREDDGTVVYESGREEFEKMVLVRNDGFPTEHARLLGVYYRMFAEWRESRHYIDLSGTEWQPASVLHTELLHRLRPELIFDTHILLFHGMVTLRNAKMSSSEGGAPLIDDLLDQLSAVESVRDLAGTTSGTVAAGDIANILVKSFFLCRPHMKPMEFSWDLLLQADNPGWAIAHAWCDVNIPDHHAGTFDADAYRLAVIRSQDFYRNVVSAAATLSLANLASFLLHFCEDYLASPSDPRLRGVVRTVLGQGLASLEMVSIDNCRVHNRT